MSHLEGSECIEALIPFVKTFSFTWFHLQAAKRRYQKQHETPMPIEMERVMKEDFMNQRYADKIKWTVRILAKLRKDIKRECRTDLVKIVTEGNAHTPCIISNADTKNKMRRIDCLRQADKVWRLDVVMVVLFRGIPLESTDGERLSKCKECQHPALCINPYHIVIHVKELEVYLVNFINNTQPTPANIIPSVFSTSELQQMATNSISEGGSTKEVLVADFLGSMLKMETDDYVDTPANHGNGQQPDLLKMCRNRKSSVSGSPRTAKRRRTLNNNCSADEGDDQEMNDVQANYDAYEPKIVSSTTGNDVNTSQNTCRLSSSNESTAYSTYQTQQQDEMNNNNKSIHDSNKIENGPTRPPFSQIGIHNHVSLNLHFNNQQQQQHHHHQQQHQQPQPQPQQPQQQQPQQHHQQQPQQQQQQQSQQTQPQQQQQQAQPKTISTSESKSIPERFIESIVQRFNETQPNRTNSHPHTIEYFHRTPTIESSTSNAAKPNNNTFTKPVTTTAINILSSREQPLTSSSNYEQTFIQTDTQTSEFKDEKTNSDNNVMRLAPAVERALPAFNTFAELKTYLRKIGLDVELVPAANTNSNEVMQTTRNVEIVQQRLSTSEQQQQQQQQYPIRTNTINVNQTPQQPQIVLLTNNDNNTSKRNDESKCNRTNSISVPPNILAEKLLEYATSTSSSIRHSHHVSQQRARSPSKGPIVSDIANLLSVPTATNKEQPIVQQVTRHTLLPPPPPPASTVTQSSSSATGSVSTSNTVYHRISSADKVSTMVKADLIHDDVRLHDREVEEYMNIVPAAAGRPTKTRKTGNAQTISDVTTKSMVLESGSASNSNDSNVSSVSSSVSSSCSTNSMTHPANHSTNNTTTTTNNLGQTVSSSKSKTNSGLSSQDSRNLCDILLMLYEQERTRSAQLQKQIEHASRQRSRNSSGQSHSSESQTGLETPQGPNHGTLTSTRILSPATWLSMSGKEKSLSHLPTGLKFDSSSASVNGSPPESQDCSPPDPNKSGLSPTKVVQFSQSISSAQNLIPRPVPMLATNDGLVRHTSSSSSHVVTPTSSTTNSTSNNGVLYPPNNRLFQSPLGQAFAALSPALSPFLSPSTSRAGTPSELMIIPTDLLNVLNSRIWNEDEILQAFVNHLDPGVSGRRSRVNNEEPKSSGKNISSSGKSKANEK